MTILDLRHVDLSGDPTPVLRSLLDAGPIVRVRLPIFGTIWAATDYASCEAVLKDHATFAREPDRSKNSRLGWIQKRLPGLLGLPLENMLSVDGTRHRRLRRLVEIAFRRQTVETLRPTIARLATEHLDRLVEARHGATGSSDFLQHVARPYPLAVICELLGLPPSDRPRFLRWASRITTVNSLPGIAVAVPGLWRLTRYLRQQIQVVRAHPRAGLMSALVEAQDEGERLTDDELVGMLFLLLLAGHETTTHLLTLMVLRLTGDPGLRETLRADALLRRPFVQEVLRFEAPVQMGKPRFVIRTTTLGGVTLEAGEAIVAFLAAANRDPAVFPDPHTFKIARAPNPHLTFGTGIHVCLGRYLAETEAEILAEQWLDRLPDVHLAMDAGDLPWVGRIGMRAVRRMPLVIPSGQAP